MPRSTVYDGLIHVPNCELKYTSTTNVMIKKTFVLILRTKVGTIGSVDLFTNSKRLNFSAVNILETAHKFYPSDPFYPEVPRTVSRAHGNYSQQLLTSPDLQAPVLI